MGVRVIASGMLRLGSAVLAVVADRICPPKFDELIEVGPTTGSPLTEAAATMIAEIPKVPGSPKLAEPLEGSVEWRLARARRLG